MSWFEEWFDSPLYELLYANRNEDEANKLADLIEQKIPVENYSTIVDVGCGRGRHSITLAERGYHITGLDLSTYAIEKAKRIAAGRGHQNVKFIVQDMRQPLSTRFDAALNLFTTFGYFMENEDNERVLASVNRMLKKNGLFLIDYFNSKKWKTSLFRRRREAIRASIIPSADTSTMDASIKIFGLAEITLTHQKSIRNV